MPPFFYACLLLRRARLLENKVWDVFLANGLARSLGVWREPNVISARGGSETFKLLEHTGLGLK